MPERNVTLAAMLSYMRPRQSRYTNKFIRRYLLDLPKAHLDKHGNVHVHVSDDLVLWSAHTDTVHYKDGRQHVEQSGQWLMLPDKSRSNCLGADDTAGCYILRELILRGVGGHYVFHEGEERGGWGSRALARSWSAELSRFKMAIALDRRGFGDVITHQGFGRCCSDTFASALSEALGPHYSPCDGGIYTDTAEYVDLVPECTNLSVGYLQEHSRNESVHLGHVDWLIDRLAQLPISDLPIDRDPLVADPADDYGWSYRGWGSSWLTSDNRKPGIRDRSEIDPNGCEECELMLIRRVTGYCLKCGDFVDSISPSALQGSDAITAEACPWCGLMTTEIVCPECLEVIHMNPDEGESDLYLSPEYAQVQRELSKLGFK